MYTCCILLILLLRFYVLLSVLYFFRNYGNPLQVVTMDFKRALCLAVLSCFYKQKFRTWHTTYGTLASLGSLGIHLALFVSSISCLCQCFATNLPLIFCQASILLLAQFLANQHAKRYILYRF